MSVLNAPLVLYSPPITYDAWRQALDRICHERLSLSLYDLPALATHAAYRSGIGPALFFEETVLARLHEEFGASVCEFLSGEAGHEDLLGDPAPRGA